MTRRSQRLEGGFPFFLRCEAGKSKWSSEAGRDRLGKEKKENKAIMSDRDVRLMSSVFYTTRWERGIPAAVLLAAISPFASLAMIV